MKSDDPGTSKVEILLKQYEQAWQLIMHFDSTYLQTSLLYMALIGAYIGVFDRIKGEPTLISVCLAMVGGGIIGAIWRIRKLIDQQLSIIAAIEAEVEPFKKNQEIIGIGKIRTSTYFIAIVIIMTVLAIILTVTRAR